MKLFLRIIGAIVVLLILAIAILIILDNSNLLPSPFNGWFARMKLRCSDAIEDTTDTFGDTFHPQHSSEPQDTEVPQP